MFTGIVSDLGAGARGHRPAATPAFASPPSYDTARPRDRRLDRLRRRLPDAWSTRAPTGSRVQASAETLARTTLGGWRVGTPGQSRARAQERRRAGRPSRHRPCRCRGRDRRAPAGGRFAALRVRSAGELRAGASPPRARSRSTASRSRSTRSRARASASTSSRITQARDHVRTRRGRRPRQSRDRLIARYHRAHAWEGRCA